MLSIKPVGQKSSARKYDIISALGTYALARTKHDQRLVLRMLTLITARYNWARNELAVGQREIARMWSVDERTVKREMAKLRGLGWLVVKRQGSRGRVTEYGIDLERLLEATRDDWTKVGPDFDLRMRCAPEDDRVIPMPVRGEVPAPDLSKGDEWSLAQAVLHAEDTAVYGSWLRALERQGRAGGRLALIAPSRFHAAYVQTHFSDRLLLACQTVDDTVTEVTIHA
jgi:hypothetical protein